MEIYNYHPITGEFISVGEADPSPLEEDVWLIPDHATEVQPPEDRPPHLRVFRNGVWGYVERPEDPKEEPTPEPPTFMPLPTLDFWLAAKQIGVFKSRILAKVQKMPEGTHEEMEAKEDMLLYIQDAKEYKRDDWRIDAMAAQEGITSEQVDAMWLWVQSSW